MALTKRTYVDGETIITAQNLNDIQDEVIAHESNKVPITRTVNSKALSSNITLSASDVGAVPTTRTVNSKALSSNITLTAADVSAVPTTRTVNSKALSSNITLTSGDIGYNSSTTYTSGSVGEAVSDLNGAINAITPLDSSPTSGSTKAISGGAVFTALRNMFYAYEEVDAVDYNSLPIGLIYNTGVGANCPTSTGYILVLSLGRAPSYNQINAQFGIDLYDGVSLWYRSKAGATWGAWSNLTKRNVLTFTKASGTSTYTSAQGSAVNGVVISSMYISPTENKAKEDVLFTFNTAYKAKEACYTRMVSTTGEVYGVKIKANENVIRADTAIPSGKEIYGQFSWVY